MSTVTTSLDRAEQMIQVLRTSYVREGWQLDEEAADRGHVEVVRRLLETEIDVDHVNDLGWTALLEAVILGDGGLRHTEIVRLLVEAGADVAIADREGVSAVEHARTAGYDEIVAILERGM